MSSSFGHASCQGPDGQAEETTAGDEEPIACGRGGFFSYVFSGVKLGCMSDGHVKSAVDEDATAGIHPPDGSPKKSNGWFPFRTGRKSASLARQAADSEPQRYSGVPSSASPGVLALSQMPVSRLKQCMQNFPTLTNVRAAEKGTIVSEICAVATTANPVASYPIGSTPADHPDRTRGACRLENCFTGGPLNPVDSDKTGCLGAGGDGRCWSRRG